MQYKTCIAFAVIISCVIASVNAHGRLIEPPSRGSMWRFGFNTPINYNDNELYCGGFAVQWNQNGGNCGVCGDNWADAEPRDHEDGGKYGLGVIGKTYNQGQTIDISVDITASHLGWFEFRLCPHDDPSIPVDQACLDQYLLEFTDGTTRVSGIDRPIIYQYQVVLPSDLTCNKCVLQWKYNTGNSWGVDPDGTGCLGCGPQEQFYGCADIAITANDTPTSTSVVSTSTTSTPTLTTSTTTSTTSTPTSTTSTPTSTTSTPTSTTSTPTSTTSTSTSTTSNPTSTTSTPTSTTSTPTSTTSTPSSTTSTPTSTTSTPTSTTSTPTSTTSTSTSTTSTSTSTVSTSTTSTTQPPTESQSTTVSSTTQSPTTPSSSPSTTATDPTTPQCVATGAYKNSPGMDQWCENNCAAGNCPASHCSCNHGDNNGDNNGEEESTNEVEMRCYATGVWATVPGMDGWCETNCALGNCPATHCDCEDVPSRSKRGTDLKRKQTENDVMKQDCVSTTEWMERKGLKSAQHWCDVMCSRKFAHKKCSMRCIC